MTVGFSSSFIKQNHLNKLVGYSGFQPSSHHGIQYVMKREGNKWKHFYPKCLTIWGVVTL